MKNYRVMEIQGLFYIQIEEKKELTNGYFWWKKTEIVTKWIRVDIRGIRLFSSFYLPYIEPLKAFKTLEEARARIKIFKSEPKIFY